jgi:hypothetical protein
MKKTMLTALLAAIVGAVVAAPLAVYASHRFVDVPDSNVFHSDIDWLAESGVTRGCNPPENTRFCPEDGVTRESMAAFLHRFAEYLGAEDGTPAVADRALDADTVDGMDASDLAPNCSPGFVFATAQIDIRQVSETEFTTAGVDQSYTCNGEPMLARRSPAGARLQVVVDDGDPDDGYIGDNGGSTIGMAAARAPFLNTPASGVNQCASAPPPYILCWTFDFRDHDTVAVAPTDLVYLTIHQLS